MTQKILLTGGGSAGHITVNIALIPMLIDAGWEVIYMGEYVSDELPDLVSLCDLAISRAGSNFIFEFLALKKPMILIPLSKKVSRGDQIENAKIFQNKGQAEVILEEDLNQEVLLNSINHVYNNRDKYQEQMSDYDSDRSLSMLFDLLSQSIA